MSLQDTAFSYNQLAAVGASPVDQVVALYDAILRDFHRATAAIAAGEIEKQMNAGNHALTVIGELQGVLDFTKGGRVAKDLDNFYNVTRAMATQACVTSSPEKFKELIGMYSRIRAAWTKVARTLESSGHPAMPEKPVAVSRVATPTFVASQDDAPPTSTGRWSG